MSEEDNSNFLAPYFKNLKLTGTGGSGTVYSAIDVETDKRVALKRLLLDDQVNCRSTLRQVKVLNSLQHENVVRLLKVVDCKGKSLTEDFKRGKEAYMMQELVDTDLHNILQNNGSLKVDHVKLFSYQLLRGLKYLHSANVIHRDVKPSNLLVDSETLLLKIGDFGQCRVLDTDYDHIGHLTHKPSTLWYRAPELSFTPFSYDSAIDIWAAGCVFAEMILGKPLFDGKHELEQIQLILESISVSEEDREKATEQMPEKLLEHNCGMPSSPLRNTFAEIDHEALDLLEQMLQFNPENRITAKEALAHPFFRDYSFPADEPICCHPLCIEHEVDDFDEEVLKDMIFEECFPEIAEEEPFLEEVVVEKPQEPREHVLSLKEIMTTTEKEEPITSRNVCPTSLNGEKTGIQLDHDVKWMLGLEHSNEELETLAAAIKFHRIFNENKTPGVRDDKKVVNELPNVLGVFNKGYINDKFTCKKNVLAGPFGLYYL